MSKAGNLSKKVRNVAVTMITALYLTLAYSNYAYAFQGSIYETGTKKLASDLLKVAQGVIGAAALALFVIWEIQKRMSEENEEVKFSKKQKSLIVGVIVAETIGTLFGLIGGYYGITLG